MSDVPTDPTELPPGKVGDGDHPWRPTTVDPTTNPAAQVEDAAPATPITSPPADAPPAADAQHFDHESGQLVDNAGIEPPPAPAVENPAPAPEPFTPPTPPAE